MSFDTTGLLRRARGLLIFNGLLNASPVRELLAVLEAVGDQGSGAGGRGLGTSAPPATAGGALETYAALFRALAERAVERVARSVAESGGGWKPGHAGHGLGERGDLAGGDSLVEAIAEAVLFDENVLSRYAERYSGVGAGSVPAPTGLPPALLAAAATDLRTLQALAGVGRSLPEMVARKAQLEESLPWWQSAPWLREQGDGETPGGGQGQQGQQGQQEQQEQQGQQGQGVWAERPARRAFVRRLVVALDWGALVGDLAAHYARYGSGVFARYRAFRWIGPPETAARLVAEWPAGVAAGHSAAALHGDGAEWLAPVVAPDVVRPGDLVGYEPERALLRRNTVQFLRRYPANNVLLYGDRGTGKSSSVKALLNERSGGGGRSEPEADWEALRLIEVPKARLGDFPLLVSLLRGRPQRFILFVDDLSFEEGETHYKELKALLEGGLEARPANVVVYATSNRRHLVREHFSDRPSPDSEEVHARDTLQEKLSFADRFGITITFPTPDQASYLAIVEALARRSGIELEPAALRSRAIEWAAWHNGRSGRTARQFVDYLIGELGVASSQ